MMDRVWVGRCANVVALLVAAALHPCPVDAAEILVVAHPSFHATLSRWVDWRRSQGLDAEIISPAANAITTRERIIQHATPATRYLMLVGDVQTIGELRSPLEVPTFSMPSTVTGRYGSTPTFPSDFPYADLDGDEVPDAAVGRLPIRTGDQLSRIIERILAYERSSDFGPWRRSLQLTGGVGGFGGFVDGAIESITRSVLTGVLPADAKPQIAYASPGHPFCPAGEPFPAAVKSRYEQGTRFWIYAGHGRVDRLDLLKRSQADAEGLHVEVARRESSVTEPTRDGVTSDERWSVESLLDNESAASWSCPSSRASIGVLMACFAGAIDAPGDCLAERLVLADGGPVAVVSATRLTMPYGNARLGLALLDQVYNHHAERIGDAMLAASQRMQSAKTINDAEPDESAGAGIELMIDGFATLLSPAGSDLTLERREHAAMYQLLGDPSLRLSPPRPLAMQVAGLDEGLEMGLNDPARLPSRLTVSVVSPIAGTLTVSVDRPLGDDALGETTLPRDNDDPHGLTVTTLSRQVGSNETVVATIELPANVRGPIVVRGFVAGEGDWASAATRTLVR